MSGVGHWHAARGGYRWRVAHIVEIVSGFPCFWNLSSFKDLLQVATAGYFEPSVTMSPSRRLL